MRAWLRVRFGRQWWILFNEGERVGPFGYRRAHLWWKTAPYPARIVWKDDLPIRCSECGHDLGAHYPDGRCIQVPGCLCRRYQDESQEVAHE